MHMLSFIVVVILMFITPGPGVLSLAGTGAAFGWRQGLRYMAGLWVGHFLVSLAVITGLATIILAEPLIRYQRNLPALIGASAVSSRLLRQETAPRAPSGRNSQGSKIAKPILSRSKRGQRCCQSSTFIQSMRIYTVARSVNLANF